MDKEKLRSAIDKALNDQRNYSYKTQLKRVVNATYPFTEELMYQTWNARKNGFTSYLEFRKTLSDHGILPQEVFYMPVEEFLKPALIPIRDTLEIDSSKLIQSFEDSEGKLRQVTNWFNCSICKFGGKIYFAYRMDFYPFAQQMKIGLCLLNEDFSVIEGSNVIPQLYSNNNGWHVEDPRLFIHHGTLYLSYTDGYQMAQASIDPETLQSQESFYLRKRMNMVTEKNWVFFSDPATGRLYSIYNSIPYTLFEMNDPAHKKVAVEQVPPVWEYGKISGGASPVLHGNYFYHFFHSSIDRDDEKNPVRRQYFCGCYVMESTFPFRIVGITTKPLLAGEYIDPEIKRLSNDIFVVFPAGVYHEGDGWVLSFGCNDVSCHIAMISDEILNNNIQWFEK